MIYNWKDILRLSLIYEDVGGYRGTFTSMQDLPDTRPYGFWLGPNVEFVPVGSYAHDRVAEGIIEKNPEKFGKVDSPYNPMFERGWARIVFTANALEFEMCETEEKDGTLRRKYRNFELVKRTPNNRQLDWMKFVASFYDKPKIIDFTGREIWTSRDIM
jgi:hypothetical protein